MKSILIKCIVAIVILMVSYNLNAQFGGGGGTPGSGGSGGGFPTTGGGPVVPFDGGMCLLLAASGVSYAAKKLGTLKRSI